MHSIPPWSPPLKKALHRNRSLPHLKFLQLATVDSSGKPHNRTIVFRGFTQDTYQLTFVTDARSDKITHLASQPWVELCWYFTKTREQFRLSGIMECITAQSQDNSLRQDRWDRLSAKAKQQFYWPAPAQTKAAEEDFENIVPSLQPPEDFVVLLFSPTSVDHLELRGNPQNRTLYHQNPDWIVQSVNP